MGLSLKPAAGVRIIKDLKGLIKSIIIAARRETNQGGAGPRRVREAWRNWPLSPVMSPALMFALGLGGGFTLTSVRGKWIM